LPLSAAALAFPIENLETLRPSADDVILLAGDIVAYDEKLSALINGLEAGEKTIMFAFERMEPMSVVFGSGAELGRAIEADFTAGYALSSDCYFEVSGGEIVGYSSARDTFGAYRVRRNLLSPKEIERWDDDFIAHHRHTGVGFGEAGEAYLKELLPTMPDGRGQKLLASLGLA